MKTNVKQRIRILLILLVTCSFLFTTGCSGLMDWWGYDASTSHMKGNNYLFANSDLNQFYASVSPVDGNVESDYRLARYLQKRGKHKFAVDELIKAIRKDPSFIKAYNALGVSYDNLGHFDLAVKSYEFALQLNPDLDYVYNNLGYSYLLNGDLDAAIDAFRKAIALESTNKRYHSNLALAYVRKGQTDMAFEEFKLAENKSNIQYKTAQIYKDPKLSLDPKETSVDTSPEGITPYDNIPKDKETFLFLAAKDHDLSGNNLGYALIPDDIDEMDLLEKSVQNEVISSNLNLSQENTNKTEVPANYTVQVSASSNLRDANLLMETLTKKGYPCPYLNRVGDERPYYRVRVGSFNDEKEADLLISELTHTDGFKGFKAIEDEHSEKIISGKQNCPKAVIISAPVTQRLNIEISNGNGVRHMARNVGAYLNPKGFNTNRLTNADHFNYPKTKIFYRKGYQQEALRLAKEIPGRQEVPDVIEQNKTITRAIKVLIGKDLVHLHEHIMSNLKSNPNVAKVENASKKTS
jgi:LytR cell envelope-related transcriptional attenuator/sporulation related protein/tetratricopeptide repeat protein